MTTSIGSRLDLISRRGPIGRRIQINVTDRQYMILRDESARSGLPVSELVRRAIDGAYRPGSRLRVRGLEVNVGLFRHPDAARVGRERPR
jgi:hypothetical protein